MADLLEMVQVGMPTVVIPLAVFGGNWALRYRSGYEQTAAADFALAVLIFDGAVVTASKDFQPFVQNPLLQQATFHWHILMAIFSCFLWWSITTFGEPVVAEYYSTRRYVSANASFPFFSLMFCWIGIFVLLALHIGFFVLRGGAL
jgi:hypothetical protein